MSVHYKFKSTLDFDTVSFDGLHISVADLKKAIFHQKRIGKNTDFDLQITNAQTKEDYTDDNTLIAKNTSLIVARVPLTSQQKRTWERAEAPTFNNTKDEGSLGKSVDLTRLDGSEEDKIRAMMTQSTQDYDPSNYMKIRGANQTGEVPPNYRCYKCHQPGHWIKHCPLGVGSEPIEIKKSTGIPRSFMVPVDGPTVPGAMMTPGGTYAVPAIDHQAYKEGKKEKPPFSHDPEPAVEKPEIPEDLLCNICKDLLTDAVMIPCCGNSFCDECIRTFLLESEDHECPDCNEKDVSPESLIPNRYLRNAVLNFKNETGYAKRVVYKQPLPQPAQPQAPLLVAKLEPTVSEKLSAEHAVAPTQPSSLLVGDAKEADKPSTGDASPSYEKATTGTKDGGDSKVGDDEAEVPPPPGTEPPLLPKKSDHSWRESSSEDDYGRYSKERRRSFSRENNRERSAYHSSRESGMRSSSRRRSLSPPNSDYPKSGYQAPPPGHVSSATTDSRYMPAPVHYDPNLRRSTEDRAGTPTVDEPHLHPAPPALLPYPPGDERSGYAVPPPVGHATPLLPNPYMEPPRMPMYAQPPTSAPPPPHGYVSAPQPPPAQRYDGRAPPYAQPPYRGQQPPRGYSGPPRAMRGMHNMGYRGMQPPPPGMGRGMHNGSSGTIDDPLEMFNRILREKDERDRRLGKHRGGATASRRTRSRSRSRSYSRSRSRSPPPVRRSSRSRSPPSKRRAVNSRSPPPERHRARSRTPKKRRSRSGSFSISRSRSYSRSQSPRATLPRKRKGKPAPYRSPARSPPRYHKERDHKDRGERHRSRESYATTASYYADTADRGPRYSSSSRAQSSSSSHHHHHHPSSSSTSSHHHHHHHQHATPPPASSSSSLPPPAPPGLSPSQPDRKNYYDSYNRYAPPPPIPAGRLLPLVPPPIGAKRFDDVAPPGTEGYFDLAPPGVDLLPPKETKDKDSDRSLHERDRRHEEERARDDRPKRDRRDNHDKDRYKDDKSSRISRADRYESSSHRGRGTKQRSANSVSPKRDHSPTERASGRSKPRDKKLAKKEKKKKDSEDKEKKRKKKREKKLQKEAAAAVVSSSTTTSAATAVPPVAVVPPVKIKEEPTDDVDVSAPEQQQPIVEESKPEEKPEENEATTTTTTTNEEKPNETSLYDGVVDETEISTTNVSATADEQPTTTTSPSAELLSTSSPKKDEVLAPMPEPSKWERDEDNKPNDEDEEEKSATPERPNETTSNNNGESEDGAKRLVTTEVLKRAENAIFQKAINAIRPIEIKKISESRKVLYQNPEPKVLEPEPSERETSRNKSVNVIINVDAKNQRNVELSSEPLKKTSTTKNKFKNLSPTRLSVKERLGEKIEAAAKSKAEARKAAAMRLDNEPIVPNPERKVFVESSDRKRDRPRHERDGATRMTVREPPPIRAHESRKIDRQARTPPLKSRKQQIVDEVEEPKPAAPTKRPSRDEPPASQPQPTKKRKKERSKSRDRKRRKDKKHKRSTKKRSKEKESAGNTPKDEPKESTPVVATEAGKSTRKNPRLASDRKRSVLDEANFEPDYSASDSDSVDDDRATLVATKRAKMTGDEIINVDAEPAVKSKKKAKQSSSDDESSSSESSSSDSDSSVESHRKKKRKHKKRKKRKTKRESSSDSEAYSDSSESSSEEEKHRRKKKSKSKSKASKKKKKSKHK